MLLNKETEIEHIYKKTHRHTYTLSSNIFSTSTLDSTHFRGFRPPHTQKRGPGCDSEMYPTEL